MQTNIVTWEDLRSELYRLFTHPDLGEDLADRFTRYMDEEIHDPAVVSIWSRIEADRRAGVSEPLTLRDLDCDLEEVVGCLVEYNNNAWNFPPHRYPPRLDFDEVSQKVLELSKQI